MASERGCNREEGAALARQELLAHFKREILIQLVGVGGTSQMLSAWTNGGEEAEGKCSARAGRLDSLVLLKEQPLVADGLLSAGSPALWPVSALRLPQPGSAEARPAASHPY